MPFGTPEVDDEVLSVLNSVFQGPTPETLPRWYVQAGFVTTGLTNGANLHSSAMVEARFMLTPKAMRIVQSAYRNGRLVYVPYLQR